MTYVAPTATVRRDNRTLFIAYGAREITVVYPLRSLAQCAETFVHEAFNEYAIKGLVPAYGDLLTMDSFIAAFMTIVDNFAPPLIVNAEAFV